MRLANVQLQDGQKLVIDSDGDYRHLDFDLDLLSLVRAGIDPQDLAVGAAATGDLVAPLQPGKIVAIGLNYLDHIRESRLPQPEQPLVFAKFPSSVIGPNDEIVVDAGLTTQVDWEVELGAVVGRRMRNVAVDTALDYVFGYTVGNDVSARDVQFSESQWTRGKSFDTFCPIGPIVVTPDEIPDPQALALRTRVNGELMQDSSTADLIFDCPTIIRHLSQYLALEVGDVVLTGTPEGVALSGRFPYLRPGDVVRIEIEGLGAQRQLMTGAGAPAGSGPAA